MRINSNQGPQSTVESNSISSRQARESASGAQLAEDHAQLSGSHAQALAAEAAQLPEIREGRVQALRQAVQGGRYQVSAEKVAASIMVHMIAGSAA